MPQELLFELNGVRITPHIATFGGTSYQVASVGSVTVSPRKKLNPVAVIIFLLGLAVLGFAIVNSRMTGVGEEYFSMAVTGVAIMIGAFFLQLVWPGRTYELLLRISSGEVNALTSRDKEFAYNVQKAIEQAFVVRARQPDLSQIGETRLEPGT